MGEEFILSAFGGESDLDQNQQVNKGRREEVLVGCLARRFGRTFILIFLVSKDKACACVSSQIVNSCRSQSVCVCSNHGLAVTDETVL